MSTSSISNVYSLLSGIYSSGSASSTSSISSILSTWDSINSEKSSSSSSGSGDTVNVSDSAKAASRLSEIDGSLSNVQSALNSARSLAELASSNTITDSFRAQLQEKIGSYLAKIDTIVSDELEGALTYMSDKGESLSSIASAVDIGSAGGAASALKVIDTAIADVKEGRAAVATELDALQNSVAEPSTEESLIQSLQLAKTEWESNMMSTLISSMQGSTNSSMNLMYSLLLS